VAEERRGLPKLALRKRVAMTALKLTQPLVWYVRTSPVLDDARKERIIRAVELLHDAVLMAVEREEKQQKTALTGVSTASVEEAGIGSYPVKSPREGGAVRRGRHVVAAPCFGRRAP